MEHGYAHIKVHVSQKPIIDEGYCQWFSLDKINVEDPIVTLMKNSGYILHNIEEQNEGTVKSYIFSSNHVLSEQEAHNIKEVSGFLSDINVPHLIELPEPSTEVLTNVK